MKTHSVRFALTCIAVSSVLAGCGGGGWQENRGPALPELPMESAVSLVNENAAKISTTVRATGSVDGFFTDDGGKRVSYHVDGTMFYLPPHNLRFDLKKLGNRQFLFGSNDQMYWVYTDRDEKFTCGHHGSADPGMLVRPDRIRDALGLTMLTLGADPSHPPIQRVTGDAQVLLFRGGQGADRVYEREYWLDRRAPRLIKRVVFRDAQRNVLLESRLGNYVAVAGGPYLPRQMEATWPQDNARMRFNVSTWGTVAEVGAGSAQFATPEECMTRGGTN